MESIPTSSRHVFECRYCVYSPSSENAEHLSSNSAAPYRQRATRIGAAEGDIAFIIGQMMEIRPFQSKEEYAGMVDYFLQSPSEFLIGMGIDPPRMPVKDV